MYQIAEALFQLDAGRHDLFLHEFLELINYNNYAPEIPAAVFGVTDDFLLQFDPIVHAYMGGGTL